MLSVVVLFTARTRSATGSRESYMLVMHMSIAMYAWYV